MSTTLNENLLLAVALAPLAGSLIAGLFGKTVGRAGAHSVTILGVAISFVLSCIVFLDVLHGASFNATVYEWMTVGKVKFEVGFLVDTLTAMMMCVVTFVSLMVHVYTIGYMADEETGYERFFSYISLFTFSMLMLVMSNNFLQLFFGWEAVGLVSYLLIGFYFKRESAIYANMKAFIVNRVGDFGFILGIGLILAYGGSMNYGDVFAKSHELASLSFPGTDWGLLTVACICLFIGAMGKSAQFPLHVWLPDSMEGPTPISALIHAATMVTAGIFMVTRMSPLFELSDAALSFITVIGAITALFMGFLGIVQNDIKRVVAYSTLSQLGYMTVALGVSAYPVAVFHLMTHAFFKALLFLGAGSVIIGMHHDQDMRNMGGLRKYMPITWITSLIGSLALIGTPFFSGFYSKDSIIDAVKLSHLPGSGFAYFAVVASVFVTALYSFRMYFMVFHGEERFRGPKHPDSPMGAEAAAHGHGHHDDHGHGHDDHHAHEPHETPWVVWLPLVLLAIPSIVIGAIAIGPMLYGDFFQHGVAFEKVIFIGENHPALHEMAEEFQGWASMGLHAASGLPVWLALAGVVVSWFLYLKRPDLPAVIKRGFGPIYTLLDNKYYMDKINEVVFARGAVAIGRGLWKEGDVVVIDGIVNGSARFIGWFASVIRFLQSGYIYHYAFAMIIGMLGLLTLFVTLGGK
ncbi:MULTISPECIES: NADH-quinone oxidoreductase subunit L [Paraburkholderia]|jgi:NADH-quinone oxidoreductase subunit L|uniref:NADH-quinone oxidoreductase subunit L n=1 Tax=Paraburkholderia caribensis TaxID=75105 RepID=A0A9Q6S2R7_9BURK|nr:MULTISPECIES: NADH-quinone oxidoreductase subunit L [Paraburkholderia]ALP62520.1 NADH:ubiquinone oxidoreductase subunit L [Paraburkholderia caribensis]AMV43130.1 NADH:ubiquinone oxidoreductase subunit L [Paraburkholderia caribensis]AUT52253.1 NADH-quinone oxidoreductase subunit L [Paraburkholderia caribensis]MCO4881307.1 NADH-quinone oxidoreductase subunit L [Paraburkholderia caribensis]MDR6386442.1 NADH-quinone oxidoreductase subunit L [Paraburkholderia caribensis]